MHCITLQYFLLYICVMFFCRFSYLKALLVHICGSRVVGIMIHNKTFVTSEVAGSVCFTNFKRTRQICRNKHDKVHATKSRWKLPAYTFCYPWCRRNEMSGQVGTSSGVGVVHSMKCRDYWLRIWHLGRLLFHSTLILFLGLQVGLPLLWSNDTPIYPRA